MSKEKVDVEWVFEDIGNFLNSLVSEKTLK